MVKILGGVPALAFLWVMMQAPTVAGHPFSFTQARLVPGDSGLRMILEINVEDLYWFHDLESDKDERLPAAAIERGIELHKSFLLRYLTVLDHDGRRLVGRVTSMRREGNQSIPMTELMSRALHCELFYSWSHPPRFISVIQDFGGEASGIPAVLELCAEGSRSISIPRGMPSSYRLSGSQFAPGYDPRVFSLPRVRVERHSGFLREEIRIPLFRLRKWLPEQLRHGDVLGEDDLLPVRKALIASILGNQTLWIDDVASTPELESIEIRDVSDACPSRVSVAGAALVIALRYESGCRRAKVALEWRLFSDRLHRIFVDIYGDAKTLSRYQKRHMTPPSRPLPRVASAADLQSRSTSRSVAEPHRFPGRNARARRAISCRNRTY